MSLSTARSMAGSSPSMRAPADYVTDIARHTSAGGMIWIFGL
jgi:hypothetical protein